MRQTSISAQPPLGNQRRQSDLLDIDNPRRCRRQGAGSRPRLQMNRAILYKVSKPANRRNLRLIYKLQI